MALSLSACAVTTAKSANQSRTHSQPDENQPTKNKPKKMLLAVAVSSALASFAMPLAAQVTNNNLVNNNIIESATKKQHKFNIATGPLEQALTTFGQQAGIILIFATELTRGVNSQGLQGNFTLEQGFTALLQGTDFTIKKTDNGYVLAKKAAQQNIGTLATAVVEGSSLNDGSAADGYRSDGNTNIGIWQGRTLQETPYSISVFSEELLQNLQVTSTDQIFKLNPLTQMSRPQAQQDQPYVIARGFRVTRSSRNGIARDIYDHGVSIEDVASVEILTGLSGFLYGPGHVGGLVNYVSKRPTEERLNSITLGNTSGSNVYVHGDFGGRLGSEGDFGYRINLVAQDGETATEHQDLEKQLASIALDWQISDNLLLQVDGSQRNYRRNGIQPYWSLNGDTVRPDAEDIDSDKLWGQKWAFLDTETQRLGANLHWQINENISMRAGYLDEEITRFGTSVSNYINADNTYRQGSWTHKNAPHVIAGKSAFIYFDTDFSTGTIEHKLNVGLRVSDNTQARFRDDDWNPYFAEGLSLSSPTYYDEPVWVAHGVEGSYIQDKWGSDSISIGDDITFNEQWSALIGFNYSNIYSKEFYSEKQGDPIVIIDESTYDESAVTPSLSIVYKPMDNITTYASYMESLEQGGTADETYQDVPVVNAGEKMKPLTSTQIEIGAKVDISGMLLTAALFEIDKSLEYYDVISEQQAQLFQDGRQIHSGFEFTATGQLTDNLTLIGGFTLLDAQTKELKDTPQLEGKTPKNVAEQMFKLYGEYNLVAVPGLVLTSSFSYTGDFHGDKENTDKIDGYTLLDIGARYQLDLANTPVTFRLNISNLTDERYWANNQYLGDGRRMSLSANVSF